MDTVDYEYIVDVKYPSTKGFLDALSAIKGPTAQCCIIQFTEAGVTVKWEHESKSMQSGVFIGHEVRICIVLR